MPTSPSVAVPVSGDFSRPAPVSLLTWPSETTLAVCLGLLMAFDVGVSELMVRATDGLAVINPLLGSTRASLGWFVAAIKLSLPVVLYACAAYVQRRSGRVPAALTWALRVLVVEYAVTDWLLGTQVATWLLR